MIALLNGLKAGSLPKALIETISEGLLETFHKAPLLDPYDVYQHLMDYWEESMQDDCYLIAADGWVKAAQPQLIIEDKSKKSKPKPDFAIGKKKYSAELLPPTLIIARYYAKEQAAIEALEAEVAALEQELEEIAEEHGGEDGLLADAKNDKDKLTKASVAARLKEIRSDRSDRSEEQALQAYVKLAEQTTEASTKLKTAQETLTAKVAAHLEKMGVKA